MWLIRIPENTRNGILLMNLICQLNGFNGWLSIIFLFCIFSVYNAPGMKEGGNKFI